MFSDSYTVYYNEPPRRNSILDKKKKNEILIYHKLLGYMYFRVSKTSLAYGARRALCCF